MISHEVVAFNVVVILCRSKLGKFAQFLFGYFGIVLQHIGFENIKILV